MADSNDRKALGAELAEARAGITGHATALRHDWDLGARLKTSVAKNRLAWMAGAAVLGLLLSKIPPLRRKVVVEVPRVGPAEAGKKRKSGIVGSILKVGLDLARPALVFWAKRSFFPDRNGATPPRQQD